MMGDNTKIEWAHHTFNPWFGCQKVGPGCDHCYAEGWAKRSGLVQWGAGAERRRSSPANWQKPLKWNAEAERLGIRYRVFCASLADVFDNAVPADWRRDLFDLIELTPHLDWLLVTKRIGNVPRLVREVRPQDWLAGRSNVWLGITVVNQEEADRDIPKLLAVPARVRFLSMEPLLGAVDLRHLNKERETNEIDALQPWTWEQEIEAWRGTSETWEDDFEDWHGRTIGEVAGPCHNGIDWIVVGGESGPHARPFHPAWVRGLRDQCKTAGVPFLFKQHGEWLATEFCDDDMAMIPSRRTVYVRPDGSFHDGADGIDFFGGEEETAWVGKLAAGRVLDGKLHDEYPEVRA